MKNRSLLFTSMQLMLLMSAVFVLSYSGLAQTTVTIGTASSTSSTAGPTTSTLSGARTERHTAIYSATELSAAGMAAGNTIFGIGWDKTGAGSYSGTDLTIRIWLMPTAATTFPANPSFATETGSATLVYETTAGTISAATGLKQFVFNTNTFTWNGSDHLQVITEIIRPASYTSTSFSWRTLASVTNAAANSNGATAVDAMTRTGTRPQVTFEIAASGVDAALTAMPNPVAAPPGGQAVDVVLRNTGNVILNTADITWNVNGGTNTVYNWVGSLVPGESITVSVGSDIFAVGFNTVTATVSNPNGAADVNPANNQVSKTVVICNALAGTYTVNQAVATGGTNFNNFNDLATALSSCGVTGDVTVDVVAGSGPYNEQVQFKNITGLGGGASVTINGNGNVLTAATTTADRHIMRLRGVSHFTINHLVINQGTKGTGWIGVHLMDANNITINGVQINAISESSVLVGGIVGSGDTASFTTTGTFSNIRIANNTITGTGKGINFYGTASANIVIDSNTINQTGADGIFVSGTDGVQISHNNIHFTSGDAIEIYFNTSNSQVYGNKISVTNPTSTAVIKGITLPSNASVGSAKIYNNLIWNMNAPGADIYGLASAAPSGAEFYFNTVILNDAAATGEVTAGFIEEGTNTSTKLRNNIFYITRPSSIWSAAISLGSSSNPASAITSDYNVFYIPDAPLANRRQTTTAAPPAATYNTLADWRTISGEDMNSYATDPFFQSGTAIPTSGIINDKADASLGISTDITGTARNPSPDPGAYEFVPPVVDAAVTDFIVPALPFCSTTLPVQFVLANAGSDPLTSATINWTINGVAQTAFNWTGNLASGASETVTIGNATVTGNNSYEFIATVSNPNATTDGNAANNSFTYTGFRRGMNGAYTLNAGAPASSTNYQTFTHLSQDLSFYGVCDAVTITVSGGPYTEQVVFNPIPGSSAVNTVTINGNSQTLQFDPTVSSNDHVLQLNGVNYMTIENMVITSTNATQGRGIHITNAASNLVIRNNTINVSKTNTSSTSFGIIVSGANYLLDGSLSENLTITGNTVIGGYSGIQITGDGFASVTDKVRNSTITGNTVQDFYGFGIYLNYTDNVTVANNRVSRPTRTNSGSDSQTPAGVIVSSGSTNFLLNKNIISDLYNSSMTSTELAKIARGFYISGTSTAVTTGTLQNNLVYGFSNTGTQYAVQDNSSGTGNVVNIYHNTFALNHTGMTGSASTSVINLTGTATTGTHNLLNNVFYLSRSGTGTKRLIDVSSANTPFTSNYNVFYFGTNEGTLQVGRIAGNNYVSFTDWQGTGKDANSVNADPAFSDPSTGNFRPMNTAVDGSAMGTAPVGVTDDILDVLRSANPDPGAYESSTPAPVNLYVFSGQRKASRNELTWTTVTETNNKGFFVERSFDGRNFTPIGFVPSSSQNGNSNAQLRYLFSDQNISGDKQYYRLKQEDRNGHFSYSKTVLIRDKDVWNATLALTGLYPNPVSSTNVNLLIVSPESTAVYIQVTDASGRRVHEQRTSIGAGSNTVTLPVTQLARGMYFVQIPGTDSRLSFIKE